MKISHFLEVHRLNQLWCFGILTNKIQDFPEDLWKKIDEHYYCGNPLSVLLQNGFNLRKCYDRSYALTMAFDRCDLVRGSLPRYGKIKRNIDDPDFDHGWVEDEKYVYDTTFMKKFDKKFYYKLFGTKVSNVISSEELNNDEYYKKMKSTTKEDIENSIGLDAFNAWLMNEVLKTQEKSQKTNLDYLKCKVPKIDMDEIQRKQDEILKKQFKEIDRLD